MLKRLKVLRGAGESYSNVILRIAKGDKDSLWGARFASGLLRLNYTTIWDRPSVLYWLHPEPRRDDFHN